MLTAALPEKPTAVAVLHVDGVTDVARLIDSRLSEQLVTAAILRLPQQAVGANGAQPEWYLGQLSESMLAVMLDTADCGVIEGRVAQLRASPSATLPRRESDIFLTPD